MEENLFDSADDSIGGTAPDHPDQEEMKEALQVDMFILRKRCGSFSVQHAGLLFFVRLTFYPTQTST